jgi:hypothetical protein
LPDQPDTLDLAPQQSSLPKIVALSRAAPAPVCTTLRVIHVGEGRT